MNGWINGQRTEVSCGMFLNLLSASAATPASSIATVPASGTAVIEDVVDADEVADAVARNTPSP